MPRTRPRPLAAALAALCTTAPLAALAQTTAPASPVGPGAQGTSGEGATQRSPSSAPASGSSAATEDRGAVGASADGATPGVPPAASTERPAVVPPLQPPVREQQPTGFSFGSYGRVNIGTDLRGHTGRASNIAAFGPRLVDEQTYAELQLHRDDNFGPVHTQIVATLAVQGPLFHETGTFDISMAVRNLYIEARDILTPGLALWAGSRMYRGDDIYLLNWWPLDNLNTVGGGARYDAGHNFTFYAHVGSNRLDSPYQFESVRVTPGYGFFAPTIPLLDRPRMIVSGKATWWLMGRESSSGVKVSLYGEYHGLPEGVRQNTENNTRELLPADNGFVLGAQLSLYTGVRNTFLNLFVRYAQGLGAYGDLAVPYTTTASQTSERARDVRLAVSGNWESGPFGVMLGGYLRYFQDADTALYGRNALWEGVLSVRPTVWFGERAGLSLEGSYQSVSYNTLDPVTGTGAAGGSLWRIGVMPFITPAGRGNFTRPHIRVIYAATLRDAGARHLYAPDDPYARNEVEHYLGLSCEWWFNSSYR